MSAWAPQRLRVNVAWTVAGNVVLMVSQWAVLTLVARQLTASDVGAFSLASSIVAPIMVFSQLQLRIVLATDVGYRYRFADFLVLRGWATALLATVVGVVVLVTRYDHATDLTILLFGLAKVFDSLADILYGYHQRREHMKVMAGGLVLNGVLSVLLFAVALLASGSLVCGMVGYAAGSLLALLAVVRPTLRARRNDADPGDQPPRTVVLLRNALPLAAVLLLAALAANVPRYVVQESLGSADLGLFSAVSYLVVAGANVINAVGNAVSPRLARLFASGDGRRYVRVAAASIAAGAAVGLLGAGISLLVGAPVLGLLYGAEYQRGAGLLTDLALAAVFGYAASFTIGAATAAGRYVQQLPVFLVVLPVSVISSLVLIPRLGLTGAALATGVTALAQLAGGVVVLRRAVDRIQPHA